MSRKDWTKAVDDREKFFKDHGLVCSCDIGRSVCKECATYYAFMGKTKLWMKSKLRRFTGYE